MDFFFGTCGRPKTKIWCYEFTVSGMLVVGIDLLSVMFLRLFVSLFYVITLFYVYQVQSYSCLPVPLQVKSESVIHEKHAVIAI